MNPTPQEVVVSSNRFALAVTDACPNDGISVSKDGAPSFHPKANATAQQKAVAQTVVDTFDWSVEAQAAWELARAPEKKALVDTKDADRVRNAAYVANTKPTADENTAQLQALTQEVMRMRGFVGKVADATAETALDIASIEGV